MTEYAQRADESSRPPAGYDLIEELKKFARATHRWKWDQQQSAFGSSERGPEPYVEMTDREVMSVVEKKIAVMEEREIQSYYESIESQEYEDCLNSIDSDIPSV